MARAVIPKLDPTARNALVVIAVIVAGAAFRWMAGILTPLALAMFLAVMIDSLARVLRKRAPILPERAALPVALALSVVLFGLVVYVVADNAGRFIAELPGYASRLDGIIAKVAGLVGVKVPPTADQLFQQLNPTKYIGSVANALQSAASSAVLVLIYLGFIIASRSGFERKTDRLFRTDTERREAADAFTRIRNGVENYLWIQTVTGLIIAAGCWAVMALLHLENALFWTFLIFILSYIPIIGAAIGMILPTLFALVQFDSIWPAVILISALEAIHFFVGNVIYPRMQGESLNMDPVVVLLSLAFWGAIWGLPGMFLSTPLTVMAMVILAQFDGSRWIAVLLSGDGDPLGGSGGFPKDEQPDADGADGKNRHGTVKGG
ncbi:AI-2E family transporter [Caulobacter sp. CCUG 60055]|uniref:AI-2E family transporter n=1 Tax=Caulobacter sp. CCUG 60055 TaxID=2100090 RepID=UPI001FA78091|nr:AI-2E family transporter [Caulobacter sp. CCUG 60055]MBQ1543301.1 AI-2E family transporter [Caulobacteraceae bacterium]MCI3179800.1 AI-2E family transporter [Caulobacter sp. CCUG 60055]